MGSQRSPTMLPPKKNYIRTVISVSLFALGFASVSATAHDKPHGHNHHHNPPPASVHRHTTVVIDRSRPGWWRGNTLFVGYTGPRAGYYFAPGYGYYAIPRGYVGRPFVVGAVVPVSVRRYVIVTPAMYGLRPPPANCQWYYAGTNFVLANVSTGVVIQSVAGGW